MVKPLTIACFIVVAIAQWLVAGEMIWKHEEIIKKGKLLRFESAPYDPEDPFRGRYLSLEFKNSVYRKAKSAAGNDKALVDSARAHGQQVFVTFTSNRQGYAEIAELRLTRPAGGDYLLMEPPYIYDEQEDSVIYNFNFPFREFYMEESKAPLAEKIYSDRLRDSSTRSYSAVRIWKGEGMIENVFINDSTLHQVIAASASKAN